VGAARAVVNEERLDGVAELAERCGRRRAGEAGADDDDLILAAVRRIDEFVFELAADPTCR
jgi:hypothetical protein